MKTFFYPQREEWGELCRRPAEAADAALRVRVSAILERVREGGDGALAALSREIERVELRSLAAGVAEIERSSAQVPEELTAAISLASRNILRFHAGQDPEELEVETMPGVRCWRRSIPLDTVGIYVPGGSAPLFSSLLMSAIPATLAGCREIVVCSPPGRDGEVHPYVLYTAGLLGLKRVFRIGGAQAIGAMAFGTESVPRCDKIFGPGNSYVTMAKQLVCASGVAIDLPAGPSELAVLADSGASPRFIAADLLSQAEHGSDSQVILATDSRALATAVMEELAAQLETLPRAEIARAALAQSRAVVMKSLDEAMQFLNLYAPEHLILSGAGAEALAASVRNAGSVFVGDLAAEAVGDYASGTNHILPTNGFARSSGGVSLASFKKSITFQSLTPAGLRGISGAVEAMARAEGLEAHRRAVRVRIEALESEPAEDGLDSKRRS